MSDEFIPPGHHPSGRDANESSPACPGEIRGHHLGVFKLARVDKGRDVAVVSGDPFFLAFKGSEAAERRNQNLVGSPSTQSRRCRFGFELLDQTDPKWDVALQVGAESRVAEAALKV